eukprot:1158245-Pelagomonas_calceolata.AAC.5
MHDGMTVTTDFSGHRAAIPKSLHNHFNEQFTTCTSLTSSDLWFCSGFKPAVGIKQRSAANGVDLSAWVEHERAWARLQHPAAAVKTRLLPSAIPWPPCLAGRHMLKKVFQRQSKGRWDLARLRYTAHCLNSLRLKEDVGDLKASWVPVFFGNHSGTVICQVLNIGHGMTPHV